MIKEKETALRNPSNYRNWSRKLLADRDCVLAAVQQYGWALLYASDKLRADREVVLAAVQQDGMVLESVGDELRADREVVLAAVQQDGWALGYASDNLRADREIVLEAVQRKGSALYYASDELRADREVVLTAIRGRDADSGALGFVRRDLRADRGFMLAAVQQNGCALNYASDELRSDKEIVFAAVQQNGMALLYASDELRKDEQFVSKVVDICPLDCVWRYKPQVTTVEIARKAMCSEEGLLLLAKQARVSLLGDPLLMKDLLISAVEQDCLRDVMEMMVDKQKKGIMNALRTVMVWYGVELPNVLPTDMDGSSTLCNLICTALCKKGEGGVKTVD